MKKKQTRRNSNHGPTKDSSSCSEDEKTRVTRHSTRKKKTMTARDSGVEESMVDLAYEADDSARSDNSPPKQIAMDEYEADAIEDVPVVSKAKKRKNGPQSKPSITKKTKKQRINLNMSTSTPVFEGGKSRDGAEYHLVTPEVTPILPITASLDNRSSKTQDPSTPTLRSRRSLRKRSFSFQDPDLSAISPQLSFNSQGDSGIAISPPLKKMKSSKAPHSSVISTHHKSLKTKCPKLPGKQSSVPSTATQQSKKVKNLYGENYSSVKSKAILRESSMNSSCFGFDSIQTPSPIIRKRKARKAVKKVSKDSKMAYRSPVTGSSDSMFDESPCGRNEPLLIDTDSQENTPVTQASPSLFSDNIFSDDGDFPSSVNKVTNKSYRGFKAKMKTSKPKTSKLDAWASSFNTELEDIEKFDLNIE